MSICELSLLYDTPCKFKLKGGKEIYGVVWEAPTKKEREFYFASSGAYQRIKKAECENNSDTLKQLKMKVDINDFVTAQPL
ncbi:MAG: hypothetical protein COA57_12520 [Flavobacteriales bacterium]|nr:hypothetical protein [Bacteroidales bacterium AH-315-I05]PCJ82953.1 MAG: hypothetical protein COA57_12520 [Flavobacteriales bacterium]